MKTPTADSLLPTRPVDRFAEPLRRFLRIEAASGVVLLLATLCALTLANSRYAADFLGFWEASFRVSLGPFSADYPVLVWINDGLMAMFFFVVGLEVKREILLGELRELRAAALPLAAAAGGMVVPALVYLAAIRGQPGMEGWGIPMATDIAFVVGCLALLGRRIPHGLRVMLLCLAIADDIGAVLVIALGYTQAIRWEALGLGAAGIAAIAVLIRFGVTSRGIHLALAAVSWFFVHESGVHATVVGVALGLVLPVRPRVSGERLREIAERTTRAACADGGDPSPEQYALLRELETASRWSISPLERFETELHPWVAFGIMPLFALANAGVALHGSLLSRPVALATMAGLVLGKPLGVLAASWVAVKTGAARLPDGVGWSAVAGGGLLCGIGFTMAMFVATLALEGAELPSAKLGVLVGSAVCALLGMVVLSLTLRQRNPPP